MDESKFLSYKNLVEIIQDKKGTNRGIAFITGADNEEFISYYDLYERALNLLFALQHEGLEPGDELVFQVNDNFDFVSVFWACILGKIIPVPVTVGNSDEFRLKLFNIWKILKRPHLVIPGKQLKKLITFAEEKDLKDIFNDIREKTFLLEDIGKENGAGEIFIPAESDIAFIQFSSGSTGSPKGVVLTHANLLTNIKAILERFKWPDSEAEADTYLSWMPLTHDMGLICLYLTALTANWDQFLIPPELFIKKPYLWLRKISQHRVTVSASPNFGFNYVLKSFKQEHYKDIDLSSLRLIVNGAEPISVKICREFIHRMTAYGLRKNVILPGYGLAEASVAVSICNPGEKMRIVNIGRESLKIGEEIKEVDGGANAVSFVDVGSPVDNCSVRITSDGGQVVGERITGHIQVKGGNVTSGYYNNKEATAKTLTPDGWLDTGDLGFLMDNRLVITGREKDVIFVNGQNYYPHDIERAAEEVEGIESGKIAISNVYNADLQMDEVLCFVVFRRTLKEFVPLIKSLKRHIIKEIGVEVDKVIPVKRILKTTSGKLQRYKLKKSYLDGEYDTVIREISNLLSKERESSKPMKPGTDADIEKIILDICKQVLRRDDLGLKDKFVESGCDSLRAAALSSIIHQELEVEIPVSEFFSGLTPAGAAEYVKKEEKTRHSPVEPVEEKEYYPVSSAQKRLYILQEMWGDTCLYNEFAPVLIGKDIDKENLEEIFRIFIKRHESLRTSFLIVDGVPVQKVHKEVAEFQVECFDAGPGGTDGLIGRFKRPFDFSKAPLLRVGLIETNETRNILLIDMHHIIIDGLSSRIFEREFSAFCQGEGERLPELKLQYKDFAQWQNSREQQKCLKSSEAYWLDLFQGEVPELNLPTDYPRPAVQNFAGDSVYFEIGKELTGRLHRLALETETTLFMILLAAYNILLSKYTMQEDIVVGSPIAGRVHPDLSNIIGMFVNMLALRNFPRSDRTFREFLGEVKENVLNAFENQEYPFESLVAKLNLETSVSRQPLLEVLFGFLNLDVYSQNGPGDKKTGFEIKPYEHKITKYDLELAAGETGNRICCDFDYRTKLFKRETIERMSRHFIKIIDEVVKHPGIKIFDINMVSEEELENLKENIRNYNNTAKIKEPNQNRLSKAAAADFDF